MGAHRTPGRIRGIAGVWLLMWRRRWRQESSLLMLTLAFGGLLFVLRRDRSFADVPFSTLFLVALANAVTLTVSAGGESLAAARRLALLPLRRPDRFVVRLLFGSPLRLVLFPMLLAWGAFHLARDLPAAQAAMELLQSALLVVGGVLLTVLLSEPVAFAWLRIGRGAFVMLSGAYTIMILAAGRGLVDIGVLSLGPGLAPVVLYAVIAAALLAASYRWSAIAPAMPPRPASVSPVARATRVLAPALRKETLMLLRMVGLRPLILLSVAVSLLAFGRGLPWLLVALPLFWLGFFLNALGADLPGGGLVRYHVAAIPLRRVLAWRHAAALLVAAGCVALAAVAIAATFGIAAPLAQDASRWSYLALFVYAAATLLLAAVPGGRIAVRYPLARPRLAWAPGPDSAGPAALMFWSLAVAALVMMGAAAAFILGAMLVRAVAPSSAGLVSSALAAGAILAAIYALAIRRGWHAPA